MEFDGGVGLVFDLGRCSTTSVRNFYNFKKPEPVSS